MTELKNRRNFIRTLSLGCAAGCFLQGNLQGGISNLTKLTLTDEKIDPKRLNYCGHKCPANCQFLKGSVENDIDLKKEAYKLWEIEKRFNVPFDPEKIFCYGCKTANKPEGIVLKNCTVRSCAMEKDLNSCIECNELQACQKELWDRFPDFKNHVIEMQKKFLAQA